MSRKGHLFVLFLLSVEVWGAVERGEVVGWGYNQYGQAFGSPGMEELRYTAIAAGGDHTLALTTNGALMAWGLNDYGQTECPAGEGYEAIAAGSSFGLALSNGIVVGWGDNSSGQLNAPTNMRFVAIAAGGRHAVGLTEEGFVVAWGNNDYGQATVPSGLVCRAISAGELHSVGIRRDGSLVAWGSNADGQLNCPPGNDYVAVAAGGFHNVALRANGRLVAWGDNSEGQTNCPSGSDYVAVAAGYYHSLALRADGSVVCWGNNGNGQANAPEGYLFGAIAAGYSHSVALKVPGLTCRFSADRTIGLYTLPVIFSGQTSSTNAGNVWFWWDLNADGVAETSGFGMISVSFTYTTGVYDVRLFVSNLLEETATFLRTNYITVFGEGVRAGFEASGTTGAIPFRVQFTDKSERMPQYWRWDLDGDGVIDSVVRHPQYTYTSAGVYSVSVMVSNDFGVGSGASYDVLMRTNYIVAFAPLEADFGVDKRRVLTNEPVQFTDLSRHGATEWYWDFNGDGVIDSTNRSPRYAYSEPGFKSVELIVSNAFGGDRVRRERYVTVVLGTWTNYVWGGGSHIVPFATWGAAATNIQDAIAFVEPGGAVFVSSGVYRSGGEIKEGTNVFVLSTNVTIRGVGEVVVDGQGVMRGMYVAVGSVEGLRVTRGRADRGGGGYVTSSGRVERVIFEGCVADEGGGAYVDEGAALYSCLVVSNTAERGGGAVVGRGGALYHCTVVENEGSEIGGVLVRGGRVWNGIMWSNRAETAVNYRQEGGGEIHYSCTTPLAVGVSNIVADPMFEGGYRLSVESPCVDSAYEFGWARWARDLDGEPRVQGAAPDMGAYEAVPEGGLGWLTIGLSMVALVRRRA